MLRVLNWLFALLATVQLQNAFLAAATATATSSPISLCGQFDDWNSTNPAQPYLYAWGDDGTGGSCLNVSSDGASWTLDYKWTGTDTLVKQYAHMAAWPSNLPVPFRNISHLQLKGTWSTVIDGTQNEDGTDQAVALYLNDVRSNVAVDMFLSADAANSTSTSPPIEIMIWPWYSIWVKPLGWQETDPNQHVVMVDGMNFSLYSGYNDAQQHVFSWLAHENMTSTDADYGPLLKYIWQNGLLSGDLWLGQLAFGTEILHAAQTTIFSMSNYNMELIRQGDKDDYTSTSTTSSTSATGTASSNSLKSTMPATNTASASPSATVRSGGSALAQTRPGMAEALCALMMLTTYTYIFS